MNSFIKSLLSNKTYGYVIDEIKDISEYELFNMGESFVGPSKKIIKLFNNFSIKELNNYPDPSYIDLKEILAKKYNINIDNIMLFVGANEAINLMPWALLEPGDSSVVVIPTFFRIIEANNSFKIKNHYVKLEEKNNYEYDNKFIDSFISGINSQNAKTAWICNPNNPIGNVISKNNIKKILNNINKDCILIVDEVYFEIFDYTNKESSISLVSNYDNLIVVRSLSKVYGLAGIRVGFIVSNPKIIKTINYIKPIMNISILSEKIAKVALSDENHIKKVSLKIKEETKKVLKEIKKMKKYELGGITKINIFLLRHKSKDLYENLKNNKILTADFRNSIGLEEKGFVRITIQDKKKNLKLLKILKEIE